MRVFSVLALLTVSSTSYAQGAEGRKVNWDTEFCHGKMASMDAYEQRISAGLNTPREDELYEHNILAWQERNCALQIANDPLPQSVIGSIRAKYSGYYQNGIQHEDEMADRQRQSDERQARLAAIRERIESRPERWAKIQEDNADDTANYIAERRMQRRRAEQVRAQQEQYRQQVEASCRANPYCGGGGGSSAGSSGSVSGSRSSASFTANGSGGSYKRPTVSGKADWDTTGINHTLQESLKTGKPAVKQGSVR